MKSNYRNISLFFTLILLLIVISGCNFDMPVNKYRSDISLNEAQSLVPYTICAPSYLPNGIGSEPRVDYHADMGDPNAADVSLRFYQSNVEKPTVEIYQKESSWSLENYYKDKSTVVSVKWDLIDWNVGRLEAQNLPMGVAVTDSNYQDGIKRWLFEFVKPESAKANMITWADGHKMYKVYTRLSVEDAKVIVHSMDHCFATDTPPAH